MEETLARRFANTSSRWHSTKMSSTKRLTSWKIDRLILKSPLSIVVSKAVIWILHLEEQRQTQETHILEELK